VLPGGIERMEDEFWVLRREAGCPLPGMTPPAMPTRVIVASRQREGGKRLRPIIALSHF